MKGYGFVGFFDILGYKEIIENNDIDRVSSIISDILESLVKRTSDAVLSKLKSEDAKKLFSESISNIESRLISDSIILAFPLVEGKKTDSLAFQSLRFLSYASQLLRLSFDQGLPLRGAIDYGDFFLSGQCFAGKPLIDCYKLGGKLDLAGCAITDSCTKYVLHTIKPRPLIADVLNRLIVPYLIPFNDATCQHMRILNWYLPWQDWGDPYDNFRSHTISAFQAHNKDIGPAVVSKVTNTEIMLHKLNT